MLENEAIKMPENMDKFLCNVEVEKSFLWYKFQMHLGKMIYLIT